MAIIKCHECGNGVSSDAKACPHCGVKPKAKTSMLTWIIGGVFAFAIGSAIINQNSPSDAPTAPAKPVDPNADLRFNKTLLVVKSIKAALRNPDSAQWNIILANDDASVVCVEYRAQNGFGGMNIEQATFAKGKIQTSVSAWNKNCAEKPLNNMKSIKQAL